MTVVARPEVEEVAAAVDHRDDDDDRDPRSVDRRSGSRSDYRSAEEEEVVVAVGNILRRNYPARGSTPRLDNLDRSSADNANRYFRRDRARILQVSR